MTTQNNPHKFTLGQRLRDRVTGFEGIANTRVEYLNGCVQYCLKPRVVEKDDEAMKMPEGNYIDDSQLEIVDQGILDPPTVHELEEILAEGDEPGTVGGRVATGGPSHREGELPT